MSVDTRLLFELGLRLIPVIVKAGLAIFGIGAQGGSGASVAVNLCPSLMAFCPATQALNGALALMCSILQTALHGVHSSSLIGWPVRVVVFVVSEVGSIGAASLADCSASQICSCAVAFLVSCLHSTVLQLVLAVVMPM
jgi:hypothetical protein